MFCPRRNKYGHTRIFLMSVAGPAGKNAGPRLFFIDNLRILLICLVIAMHVSITYGGPGGWYFADPGNSPGTPFILAVFNSLTWSFFMGLFFFVSAYFVHGSLARKGRDRYVHDRLVRLGIPILAWILLINPFILVILTLGTGTIPANWEYLINPVNGGGIGPMWFALALLGATFAYLVWAGLVKPEETAGEKAAGFPGIVPILLLGLLLGFVTAVVRIFQPIGTWGLFNLQLAFFPQFIAFFILGIYASRSNWFDEIPARVGKMCTIAALVLVAIQLVFVNTLTNSPAGLQPVMGGLNGTAFLFAFWEQMTGVLIIFALLWIFSRWFNSQGPAARAMSGDSYTVYIINPVIVIILSLALAHLAIPSLGKCAIVLPLATAFSFILAHGIRLIPGMQRVL